MIQCQECRRERRPWRDCPGTLPWYEPGDIRFCPNQMVWLMGNLNILGEGQWPPDPNGDSGNRRSNSKQAPFETPACFHAEITLRLNRCGKDGILAYQHWGEGTDEITLSELMGIPDYKVRRRLRRVLAYISGWKRKTRSYDEFVQHRKQLSHVN